MRGNLVRAIIICSLALLNLSGQSVGGNWMTREGIPDNSYEEAVAIIVDESGNAYVTGNITGGKEGYDFATIKYTPNGDTIWTRQFNGPKKNGSNLAVCLGNDRDGNLLVAGYSESKESERLKSLAVAGQEMYKGALKGLSTRVSDYDIAAIKYSPDGSVVWSKYYKGRGGALLKNDIASAMAMSESGCAYIVGMTNDSAVFVKGETTTKETGRMSVSGGAIVESTTYIRPDAAVDDSGYFALKVSPTGEMVWRAPGMKSERKSMEMVTGVAVDFDGNCYVIGTGRSAETGFDYAIAKHSSNGESVWLKNYNGPRSSADVATAVCVDDTGFVYVTGESQGKGTSSDYATIKYNPDGVALWTKRFDAAKGTDSPVDIVVDKRGDVIVTGTSQAESFDFATVRYHYTGDLAWVARYDGPGKGLDKASAMAMDENGNVYVTGRSLGDGTGFDFATVKYSPSGDTLWVRRFDGQKNGGADGANAIAIDKAGNVYVTGTSWGGPSYYDYLTIKYSPTGEELWARRYSGQIK